MFKMSICGVTLLLAGVVGLACGGQPGLNVARGNASGGQASGVNGGMSGSSGIGGAQSGGFGGSGGKVPRRR